MQLSADPLGGRFHLSLFEYLAAGYILMLSLAVLRAMSGVPHAVRSPHRYWVHISWLFSALIWCLMSFWCFWPYRDVEWTVLQFMGALAIPALLYSYNSLLVPPDPAAVVSWRDYFFAVRTSLFATGAVFMTAVIVSNQVSLGVSPLHASQLLNYVQIGLYVAGFVSAKPSLHSALALAFPGLLLIYLLTLMVAPDSVFHTGS